MGCSNSEPGGEGNGTFGEGMGEWHGACEDQSDQGEGEESEGQGAAEIVLEIYQRCSLGLAEEQEKRKMKAHRTLPERVGKHKGERKEEENLGTCRTSFIGGKHGDDEVREKQQRHCLDAKPDRRAVGVCRYRIHHQNRISIQNTLTQQSVERRNRDVFSENLQVLK